MIEELRPDQYRFHQISRKFTARTLVETHGDHAACLCEEWVEQHRLT